MQKCKELLYNSIIEDKQFKQKIKTYFTKESTEIVSKHMKRCLTSLVIWELQIKPPWNSFYIPKSGWKDWQ